MKSIRRFVFAALICAGLQPVQAQVASPDTMVHKIFATLQAKDQQAFVALYPNAQQFGHFIRSLMEKTFNSEEMKKLMAQDEKAKDLNLDSLVDAQVAVATSPETFAQMEQEFGKIFQRTIEKGEKKGVNWSEAKLTGYTIDSSATKEEGMPFQPGEMKTFKGVIEFASGDQPYQLAFDKVIFLPTENGWFGADFPQLARKGESLAPDKVSESAATDEMPAPKKPATPAKKAPVKKTGTKAPVKKKATS